MQPIEDYYLACYFAEDGIKLSAEVIEAIKEELKVLKLSAAALDRNPRSTADQVNAEK